MRPHETVVVETHPRDVDQGRMWKFPADVLRYFFAYLLNELEPATPIERLRLIADEMEREGA